MEGKDPERDRKEALAVKHAQTVAPALKKQQTLSIFDMMGGMKSAPTMKKNAT